MTSCVVVTFYVNKIVIEYEQHLYFKIKLC